MSCKHAIFQVACGPDAPTYCYIPISPATVSCSCKMPAQARAVMQMLATLPPALLAEAQALRERAHRIHRDTMITARRTTTARLPTGGQLGDVPLIPQRTAFDGRLPRPDAWLATRSGYMAPGASHVSMPPETDGQPQARKAGHAHLAHAAHVLQQLLATSWAAQQ